MRVEDFKEIFSESVQMVAKAKADLPELENLSGVLLTVAQGLIAARQVEEDESRAARASLAVPSLGTFPRAVS